MSPEAALIELLDRLGARNGASVTVNTEELNQWPTGAISALKSQGLLLKARPAVSVVCPGCEQQCTMPVHTPPRANGQAMSFVLCEKRSDINRVAITTAMLAQWRCDAQGVCGFVAECLGLQQTSVQRPEDGLLPIGIARGSKRTQMLCLRVQGHLELVVGADAMPLAGLVEFAEGRFTLDQAAILQMVDASTPAYPRHTPSTAKRDARKLGTQAMYASWQKVYRALRKKHPGKSDVWYSQQIARTDKVNVRDPSTIKKHMKS